MLVDTERNACTAKWTDFFYIKRTGVTSYYQYKGTDDVALPVDLVQPPKDLPVSFAGCKKLVDIESLRKWDMTGVTSTRCMFRHCHELHDLSPIAHWEMYSVKDMSYMFQHCKELSRLGYLMEWELCPSVKMDCIFADCPCMSKYVTERIQSFSPWRIYMAFLGCKETSLEIHEGEMEYYKLLETYEFAPM